MGPLLMSISRSGRCDLGSPRVPGPHLETTLRVFIFAAKSSNIARDDNP